MKKSLASAAISSLIIGLSLTGCGNTDPCSAIPPPSVAQMQAANEGVEVEVDVNGGECELAPEGYWVFERETSSHSGSSGSSHRTSAPFGNKGKVTSAPVAPRVSPKTLAPAPKAPTPVKPAAPAQPKPAPKSGK